jgi:hypothetical protein
MIQPHAITSALICSLASLSIASAQSPGELGPPPAILSIDREEVKPGKAAAHSDNEARFPHVWAKANWPTHYLAAASITGPSEAWFFTGYTSMAALDQDAQNEDNATTLAGLGPITARDGELLANTRTLVAAYVDSLSYNPGVELAAMRFFHIITVAVRPGREKDFVRAAKTYRSAYDKAKDPSGSRLVYRVTFGMPDPTFLVLVPVKSLGHIDDHPAQHSVLEGPTGTQGQEPLDTIAAAAYIKVESNLFSFSPKMSYVSKDFAARDPEFWLPKATPAAKASSKAARDTIIRNDP